MAQKSRLVQGIQALVVVGAGIGFVIAVVNSVDRRGAPAKPAKAPVSAQVTRGPEPAEAPSPAKTIELDQGPEAQKKRDELIAQYTQLGLIKKVELVTENPTVWTGPMWDGADFEDKQLACSVVWARHYAGQDPDMFFVKVRASKTSKLIGRFDRLSGLSLD